MGVGAIIVALGTIVGAVYGLFKFGVWQWGKTSSEKARSIDEDVAAREKKMEETGRPQ